MRTIIPIGLLLFGLSGCVLSPEPPLQTFTLATPPVKRVAHSPYAQKVLKVSFPQSVKEPLSDKIPFSYSSGDRGYYLNSSWSNNIGQLLQGVLMEGLEKSHLFKAVLPYASTAGEDLRLESMAYDISHHLRGEESYAIFSVGVALVDAQRGKLLKVKRFSYKEPTPTVDAKGYVRATQKALARFENDLIAWLAEGHL